MTTPISKTTAQQKPLIPQQQDKTCCISKEFFDKKALLPPTPPTPPTSSTQRAPTILSLLSSTSKIPFSPSPLSYPEKNDPSTLPQLSSTSKTSFSPSPLYCSAKSNPSNLTLPQLSTSSGEPKPFSEITLLPRPPSFSAKNDPSTLSLLSLPSLDSTLVNIQEKKPADQAIPPFSGDPLPYAQIELPSFNFPDFVHVQGLYKLGESKELCIIQPDYNHSCGPGATLMMLSHFMLKNDSLELGEGFWKWYAQSPYINQIDLINAVQNKTTWVSDHNFEVKGRYYNYKNILDQIKKNPNIIYEPINNHHEDILNKLKTIQEAIRSPIIVSVTNKVLFGHWIVIDKIKEDGVFIRDPFSGKAFKISIKEMHENWEDEDEVKVIYLQHLKP